MKVCCLSFCFSLTHCLFRLEISGGWDRRILIWNLRTGQLHDQLRSASKVRYDVITGEELSPEEIEDGVEDDELTAGELACDGVILAIEYCVERLVLLCGLRLAGIVNSTLRLYRM